MYLGAYAHRFQFVFTNNNNDAIMERQTGRFSCVIHNNSDVITVRQTCRSYYDLALDIMRSVSPWGELVSDGPSWYEADSNFMITEYIIIPIANSCSYTY